MIVNEERNQDTGDYFREVIDHDLTFSAGTVRQYVNGLLMAERAASADELTRWRPEGLTGAAALATLLAVHEVVPVAEAAAIVGLPAQALVDEALAWGMASQ